MEFRPEVVEKETSMKHILRADNNVPMAAALRLCRYWKARKQLFEDRWLLPLDQTGFGALSHDDVQALRSGIFVCVPRPCGGVAILYDKARAPEISGLCIGRLSFCCENFVCREATSCTVTHVVTS